MVPLGVWTTHDDPAVGMCRNDNEFDSNSNSKLTFNSDYGWRFVTLTLEECKKECVSMGCVQIYRITDTGACYPFMNSCTGSVLANRGVLHTYSGDI